MSDTGPTDPVTVSTDGVTVRKELLPERFSTPAIAFTMESDRDVPVVIRLTDPLPADASLDEVGFHPDFGSQFWTAEPDRLTFEYRLDPGDTYETVYGLRADDPNQFMADFDLEATAEAEGSGEIQDVSEIVSAEDSQAVRDMIASSETGDTARSDSEVSFEADAGRDSVVNGSSEDEGSSIDDSLSGASASDVETETESDDTPIGELAETAAEGEPDDEPFSAEPPEAEADGAVDDAVEDLLGGAEGPESADDAPDVSDAAASSTGEPSVDDRSADNDVLDEGITDDDGASVGADGTISEAADEVLGPSIGSDEPTATMSEPADDDAGGGDPPRTDARSDPGPTASPPQDGILATMAAEIREGDVLDDDLETLTTALNQTTPSLESRVRYLQNEMTELAAYTDALEAFIDEHGNATGLLSDLRDGLASLEDRMTEFDSRLDDRLQRIERLEERMDAIDSLEERVANFDDRLSDRADETAELEAELSELRSSVQAIQTDLDAIDELQDDLGDVEEEVSDLTSNIRSIEADIESVKEFRDRFRTVFAGDDDPAE